MILAALPLIALLGSRSSMAVSYGGQAAYNLLQGNIGNPLEDAGDALWGGKNDTMVGCLASLGACFIPFNPLKVVRAAGEAYNGDFMDAFMIGTSALTGMKGFEQFVSTVGGAKDMAQAGAITKEGLAALAKNSGTSTGVFFKDFVDPWKMYFTAARQGAKNTTKAVVKKAETVVTDLFDPSKRNALGFCC